MSGEQADQLRMILPRNYGIKVKFMGAAVLGLRIPRTSVADILKEDTDSLYSILHSNREQIRPSEIAAVFIIADADHLEMEPLRFFEPIIGDQLGPQATTSSSASIISVIPVTEAEVLGLASSAHVLDTIPPQVPEVSQVTDAECDTLVELIPREYVPDAIEGRDTVDVGYQEGTCSPKQNSISGKLEEDSSVTKFLNDISRNSKSKRLATGRLKSGRRAEVLTKGKRGRYVRYRMPDEKITDIAIAPTVRAAALHAKDGKLEILRSDIREKVRRRRISSLISVVFDTSGSMDEQHKIMITKSVVLALLKDAYQRRDRVSLVTYSGRSSSLVLPFTSSVEAAKRYLETVPFGGTTPMAAGVLTGLDTMLREVKKEPSAIPILVLVTDGTANCALHVGGNIRREILHACSMVAHHNVNMLLIDISPTGSALVQEMARHSKGSYYHPGTLSKEALYSAIAHERDSKTNFSLL